MVLMECIPELSLIDLSIPQHLCKELFQLYCSKGGVLNSVEVKSPDSSSVVKIFPKNDELIIKVLEPHYLLKRSRTERETPSLGSDVKIEQPNEECNKYHLKCLIPFTRYEIAEQSCDKEDLDSGQQRTSERKRTVTETSSSVHNTSNESITDFEQDNNSVLENVDIKEEVEESETMTIDDDDDDDDDDDSEVTDLDLGADENEREEPVKCKPTELINAEQRERRPRKRGRPRKVVAATLPTKSKPQRRKPTKQRTKKVTRQAPLRSGSKRKSEDNVKKRRKKTEDKDDDDDDDNDQIGREEHKPKIGRPKKNLEYRNLNTLALECKYCGLQYSGVAELINHVSVTHNDKADYKAFIGGCVGMPYEKLFVCELCGIIFRQVYMLRRHVRLEHKDDSKFEAYLTKLGGKLMPNSVQQSEEDAVKCQFCPMSSPQGYDVYEHTKMKHVDEPNYESAQEELRQKIEVKCDLCDKAFINPKYIYTHMKLTHCNETHVCDICGNVFKNKYLLRGHIRTVHDADRVKLMCDRCPSTFATINKLQLHIRMVHDKVGQVPCPECGKTLSTENALKCHVEAVHQRLRPNMCEYCGKEFYSGKDLRAHVKVVHEYVNKNCWPHECNICCRKFADKRNMNKHIQQVHNKVFPFTCQICSKGFPQGKGFRDHISKHHPQLVVKVQNDAKIKTVMTSDLEEVMLTGGTSPSSDVQLLHQQQPPQLRFDQSPFPMLQSAISDQETPQQVTGGPSTSVTNNMALTASAPNSQLMSFADIHLGGRNIPLENRNIPYDNRNMLLDERGVHLDSRNVQMDNRIPHIDNNSVHINNRHMHMNSRNIPVDTRNVHLDSRNIPLDSRNLHLDSRNIHLDNRNIHIDNRNTAIGNYYQF